MVESSIGSVSSPIRPSPSIVIRFATSLSLSEAEMLQLSFKLEMRVTTSKRDERIGS